MSGFVAANNPIRLASSFSFCDIGLNLLDDMFRGTYHGKQIHPDDLLAVLDRGKNMGVRKCIVTAGSLEDSVLALDLVSNLPQDYNLYSTVGIHPTRANELKSDPEGVLTQLESILERGKTANKVVAIGECGLDYDRLHFCGKQQQLDGFRRQLDLAEKFELPLFLHDRNTRGDFLKVISEERSKIVKGGVVHSFTGTKDEMNAYLDLGFYISVNGCSLKTEENLAVVIDIPVERLLFETDAPWCSIKNTHASMSRVKTHFPMKKKEKFESGFLVKDRNEPCNIIQVLEVVADLKGMDPMELSELVYRNTEELFFPSSDRA